MTAVKWKLISSHPVALAPRRAGTLTLNPNNGVATRGLNCVGFLGKEKMRSALSITPTERQFFSKCSLQRMNIRPSLLSALPFWNANEYWGRVASAARGPVTQPPVVQVTGLWHDHIRFFFLSVSFTSNVFTCCTEISVPGCLRCTEWLFYEANVRPLESK